MNIVSNVLLGIISSTSEVGVVGFKPTLKEFLEIGLAKRWVILDVLIYSYSHYNFPQQNLVVPINKTIHNQPFSLKLTLIAISYFLVIVACEQIVMDKFMDKFMWPYILFVNFM